MSEQGDLFKADATWFHVFRSMFENETASKIGPYAFTVYCAIKSHADFHSGEAFPSVGALAKKTGISERQIKSALVTLEENALLRKEKIGRSNHYVLREHIPILESTSGEVAALATWDYAGMAVKYAVQDLKNVVISGDLNGAKIVHIERMHVEIKQAQVVVGSNNTAVQIGDADLASLPEDMRSRLAEIGARIKERNSGGDGGSC